MSVYTILFFILMTRKEKVPLKSDFDYYLKLLLGKRTFTNLEKTSST